MALYEKKSDYNEEKTRFQFVKIKEEFVQKCEAAQDAINAYKANVSSKQKKLQESIDTLKLSLEGTEKSMEKAETGFASATATGDLAEAQAQKNRLESLLSDKEKTLHEIRVLTNAIDKVKGDERLYKQAVDKYKDCVELRKKFFNMRGEMRRIAKEQIDMWESFSNDLDSCQIQLGIRVGGYDEMVKKHGNQTTSVL